MSSQFTKEEISRAVELLIQKFSKISIFSHILDEYFEGGKFVITRKTGPLSLVLSELTFHISGQLSRLCFDTSSRDYKTASITEVYNQIETSPEKEDADGFKHLARFEAQKIKIQYLKKIYMKKFKLLSDKHYAYLEVRSVDEVKQDYQDFQMSWGEIKGLIEGSKSALFEINLFWNDNDTDFADTQYSEFKRRFWDIISLPDPKSPKFFT